MYLSGFRTKYLREHKKRLTVEALPTPPRRSPGALEQFQHFLG